MKYSWIRFKKNSQGIFARAAALAITAALVMGSFAGCEPSATVQSPQSSEHISVAVKKADFFIATNGNDSWSGTLDAPNRGKTDGPFATLERTRQAVSDKVKTQKTRKEITVMIRGGVYSLENAVNFGAEDSGTKDAPINYLAYPGENPVFSGGKKISGFQKAEGKLWSAKIPEVDGKAWVFNQLFVGGARRQISRTPNEGYYHTTLTNREGFYYNEGDILKSWKNIEEARIVMMTLWTEWRSYIWSVDEEARYTRLKSGVFHGGGPPPFERYQRYFIENTFEGVDSPGEWYLDQSSATLYYYPQDGEDMNTIEVTAPYVKTTLLNIQGDIGDQKYFEYVNFQGISFQHADAVISKTGSHNSEQADTAQTAAVVAIGMRNCRFIEMEVASVGEYGIWLRTGCRDNRIVHSHIYDTGSGGIRIGETATLSGEAEAVGANTIENSLIHNGSNIFYSGPGIWVGRSSNNVIKNNEICDYYEMGISIGWQWGYQTSTAKENYIGYNRIHDIGKGVFTDMGAIYSLGISTGTTVENNMIYNVVSYPAYMNKYMPETDGAPTMGSGIYPDEGSSGITFRNNIVYDVNGSCFAINYGRDNKILNNIFIFSRYGMTINTEHDGTEIKNNIFYGKGSRYVYGGAWDGKYKINNNVYWTDVQEGPLFRGEDFEGWKNSGWKIDPTLDDQSVVADPGFQNLKESDFTLKNDSPALALGFQPINTTLIGLQGEAWTNRRADYPLKKNDPSPPPRSAERIDDDFEGNTIGEVPSRATVIGTGKIINGAELHKDQCLLMDGSMTYEPFMEEGEVKLSFAFYLDGKASLLIRGDDRITSSTGLSVGISSQGSLSVNNTHMADGLQKKWVTLELSFDLSSSSRDLTVIVKTAGKTVAQNNQIKLMRSDFNALHDLIFQTTGGAVYLDDMLIQQ